MPDPVSTSTVDSGTVLGAIAVIVSLLISAFGLIRSWNLDRRAAKKQDIDTVIENYRLLLSESKDREKKLEKMVDDLRRLNDKNEEIIAEQRITISRLEGENAELKRELEQYRAAKTAA